MAAGYEELPRESLARHTTFKIGGPVDRLLIPRSCEALLDLVVECRAKKIPHFILGRGSNVLARDGRIRGVGIKNTAACRELSCAGNRVRAGASVPLQEFIRFCHDQGRVGMEYLYSVPGNIGGSIYMNAGTGEAENQALSDYLVAVDVFDGEKLRTLAKEDCQFSYRTSVFQARDWLILAAEFELPAQDKAVGEARIRERMDLVKALHDLSYPNAGTIFKRNFKYPPVLNGHRIGNAMFSVKTPGWIINLGGATYKDVDGLIQYAKRWHKRKKLPEPELEICILGGTGFDRFLNFFR